MKTLKIKTITFLSFLAIITTLRAQTYSNWPPTWPGISSTGWGPSGASTPALFKASPWVLGGNWIDPGNTTNSTYRTASEGTINDVPFVMKANNRESIFILSSSNVGVGWNNSNPTVPLDIWSANNPASDRSRLRIFVDYLGHIESSEHMSLHFANDRNFYINQGSVGGSIVQRFQIKDGGYVGINSTTPGAALDIKSPAGATQGNIKIYGDQMGNIESIGPFNMYHNTGSDFCINEGSVAGSTSRLKVKTGGFVGINNSTPAAALDIKSANSSNQGNIKIYGDLYGTIESSGHMNLRLNPVSDFVIGSNASPVDYFTIKNGNVGINEVAPNEKLDVNGNLRVQGNLGVGAFPALEKFHVAGGNMRVDGNMAIGGSPTQERLYVNGGNARINGKIGVNCAPSTNYSIKAEDLDASVLLTNTSSNPCRYKAGIITGNGLESYDFGTDANGIGRIKQEDGLPCTLISFKPLWISSNNYVSQVWIGRKPTTNHTDFRFAVDGKIVAQSIYLTLNCGWADYVFASDYKLPKLEDVEAYYKTNKHLPEIPSSSEVEENGIDVAEMNKLLLKKVEELTIYVVEQKKELEKMKQEIQARNK
jgi:hypothetical protein